MIVTMSKVEIAGPKDLLREVLALLRELGLFQVDPAAVGFIEKQEEHEIRSFALDERTAVERLSLEELRGRIDDLFSHLPSLPLRESYIEPETVIDSLSHTVDRHRELARSLAERRDELQKGAASWSGMPCSSVRCQPSCPAPRKPLTLSSSA